MLKLSDVNSILVRGNSSLESQYSASNGNLLPIYLRLTKPVLRVFWSNCLQPTLLSVCKQILPSLKLEEPETVLDQINRLGVPP